MSGAELLTQCLNLYPDMVRVLLTGYADIDALAEAVNEAKIYNYITKPWDDCLLKELLDGAIRNHMLTEQNRALEALTQSQNEQLQQLNSSLEQKVVQRNIELLKALKTVKAQHKKLGENFTTIVDVLSGLLEHREGKRAGHNRAVAQLCVSIAKRMKLKDEEIRNLYTAARLHDVGMIGLSDTANSTPLNQLRGKELAEYKKHPSIAESTLANIDSMESVAKIIATHHEKIDGSGFPHGLNSNQVPLTSKILSVVSDYHDLLHGRFHDGIEGCDQALNYLRKEASDQYDQQVVAALNTALEHDSRQTRGSKSICCTELMPDMCLAEDLVSDTGLLLLRKGSTPSQTVINKLINYQREANTKLQVLVELP